MNEFLVDADAALSKGEDMVISGLAGYAPSKEEARKRLHKWADGTMQTELSQQLASVHAGLNACIQRLSKVPGMPQSEPLPPKSKEQEAQENKYWESMRKVGTTYVEMETLKNKANLALIELARLETEAKAAPSSAPAMPAAGSGR